ncbi:hypothetical protein M8494_30955 [Serratia ureilytica]
MLQRAAMALSAGEVQGTSGTVGFRALCGALPAAPRRTAIRSISVGIRHARLPACRRSKRAPVRFVAFTPYLLRAGAGGQSGRHAQW